MGNHQLQKKSLFNGSNVASTSKLSNGNSSKVLKHDPGFDSGWSTEEKSIMDEYLIKFSSDESVLRYAKISMLLPNKTVRDVALRMRWMTKKEPSKRRKDDHTRRNKEKREKVTESSSKSQLSSRPGGPPYSAPPVSLENGDEISYKAIGGPTGELLEQNSQYLQQIDANLKAYQINDNIDLLCYVWDNLLKIMNSMNDIPEIMKQMPPLPVTLNEELANSFLHR